MDVRCENCGTEYELDESKLRTGGVTVKCASCGHMFKIRKRAPTPLAGPPLARGDSAPAPRSRPETSRGVPTARPATARPGSQSGPIGSGAKKKRTWLVRTSDGEVKTCSELATLQQWIVAGAITRHCEISRNGKTWKPLGDISELSMFFDVADEARRSRDSEPTPVRARPVTQPPPAPQSRAAGTPAPPRREPIASSPMSRPPPAALHAKPGATTLPGGVRPPPVTAPRPAVAAPPPSAPVAPPSVAAAPPNAAPPNAAPNDERATGAWAAQKQVQRLADRSGESGPSGPIGGLARGIPTTDAAFAHGNKQIPRLESEPRLGMGRPSLSQPSGGGFGDADLDDDLFSPARKSRAGMWIALVSLLIIGGAAATVYLFVFRDKGNAAVADAPIAGDAGAADGLPVPDPSGTAIGSDVPALDDDAETNARAVLHGDSQLALEELSTRLGSADSAVMLALRSRIEAALAQHLLDEALAASDDGEGKKLRKQARARAQQALALARKAVGVDAKQVDAAVAMADAVRVDGQKSAEVARWVRKARGLDKDNREAAYVEALLDLREGKKLPGTRALRKLAGSAGALGDVRPAYRLALVDFEAKAYDQAREGAQRVLAVQPGHAGAPALLSRIGSATAVVTSDPMPPEQPTPDRGSTSSSGSSGGGYDALLERADKKAEGGDCKSARDLYQKALDANPVGVAALTGLGYCHIDAREFASAQGKFRAALSISPRYQDALLGVAEAYQQQGLKPQAIAAYQKFIEEHPSSPRSATAKRQIEKLGGTADSGGGGGGGGAPAGGGGAPAGGGSGDTSGDDDDSGGTTPTPTPAPTPAPTPTPDPPVEESGD